MTGALLGAVAGAGLPGCAPALPDGPLPAERWDRLLDGVRRQRLEGALAHAVAGGHLPVTDDQHAEAAAAHQRAMALTLLLEHELGLVADRWGAAGVPFRVLKGPALAHLDEPDPAWRAFGDLDVLVRAEDLATVVDLVAAAGGRRRFAEPAPGYDRRVGKGISFAFDRNVDLDVHRTLAPGPWGFTLDLDELFTATAPFTVAGRSVTALDRPSRFLHAAVHAVLGQAEPRLGALRDLVRTAPAADAELATVADRSGRWQLDAVVALAVDEACAALAWTPPAGLAVWADATVPTARDRRWLRAYRGAGRSSAAQTLRAVSAVPGVGGRLSYAWTAAVPSAAGGRPAAVLDRWRGALRSLQRRP